MKSSATLFFALIVPAASGAAPTLISIMVDDLDASSYEQLLTAGLLPNISAIADRGMTFSRAITANPLCAPTRATLLDGRYSHNNNVTTNRTVVNSPNPVLVGAAAAFDDSQTVATILQQAGYHTFYVGKYINGYGTRNDLADVSPVLGSTYVPPGWSEWRATVGNSAYCMYGFTVSENGMPRWYPAWRRQYQTDVLADYADGLIRGTPADEPLFMVVAPLAPHAEERCGQTDDSGCGANVPDKFVRPAQRHIQVSVPPKQITPAYDEDVDDKPDSMQRAPISAIEHCYVDAIDASRKRSMLAVDDLVGNVINALKDTGRWDDDTVVVFTSDGGFMLGEHRRYGKGLPYADAYQVPLVISPAGVDASGALVSSIDLVPTWLELAGVPAPDLDGTSLAPLLDGTAESVRTRTLIEHRRAVPQSYQFNDATYSAVLSADTLYTEWTRNTTFGGEPADLMGIEEYDLMNDPYQIDSLRYCGELGPACDTYPLPPDHALLTALQVCAGDICRALEQE